jgi:hypothetical protein
MSKTLERKINQKVDNKELMSDTLQQSFDSEAYISQYFGNRMTGQEFIPGS